MHIYILKRLLALIPTLLGITVLVFFMVHLVPGDPAQIMLGERASAESLAALRRDLGLDQPLHVQFGRYLSDLLQGDLGRSIKSHERVSVELMARFPATMELTFASMVFACILGIGAGIASAGPTRHLVGLYRHDRIAGRCLSADLLAGIITHPRPCSLPTVVPRLRTAQFPCIYTHTGLDFTL